ncbi:MAG: aspartyl protease family protein [Kordiimonas sp.]
MVNRNSNNLSTTWQVLFLTLFFNLQSLSSSLMATDAPPPLAELSYKLVNNRVQLTAYVDNTELHFLLDTGASRTVLFQTDKHPFTNLPQVGQTEVIFPALDEIISGITLGTFDINLGKHIFTPPQALLIQKSAPVGDRLSVKFDGILGQDFFMKYLVEVNPKTRLLRIYHSGTKLKKRFRTRLNLHMDGNAPHIKFMNKFPWEHYSKPKKLLLDTGYPGSMVIWSERHFRRAAGIGKVDDMRKKNIGIFTRATFTVGSLRFFSAPIFIAANEPKQANKRDGLLGSNVLSQFHHAIDFQSKKLWLSVVGVHKSGVDGAYYLPNNEDFIVRDFDRPKSSPMLVIE